MLAARTRLLCFFFILLFTSTRLSAVSLFLPPDPHKTSPLVFQFLIKIGFLILQEAAEEVEMVPLLEPGKVEMMVMVNDSRRKLGSFQICSLCTCCGGASRSYCLPSPCCYAINCNIPNRPFGFCSFTPKTCNCFGCHI